jgi:hypothetical protein
MTALSAYDEAVLAWTYLGMAALSAAGSLFIIAVFALCKEARTFANHLVVCLAVCDLMSAVPRFIPMPTEESPACYAQALLESAFVPMSAFCTLETRTHARTHEDARRCAGEWSCVRAHTSRSDDA